MRILKQKMPLHCALEDIATARTLRAWVSVHCQHYHPPDVRGLLGLIELAHGV